MENRLQQGTRYDFTIRDANGRSVTSFTNLAFVGYGRWVPEVESQPEFAVVLADDGATGEDHGCHHVWNVDRIVEVTEAVDTTV